MIHTWFNVLGSLSFKYKPILQSLDEKELSVFLDQMILYLFDL